MNNPPKVKTRKKAELCGVMCDKSNGPYLCTRLKGHVGNHIARGGALMIYAEWKNEVDNVN